MELTNKTDSKRSFGKYHDGKLDDKVAYGIRMTVLVVILLLAYQFDSSGHLMQLSKWARRAVILAGALVSMELLYFVIIKLTLLFFQRGSTGGGSE